MRRAGIFGFRQCAAACYFLFAACTCWGEASNREPSDEFLRKTCLVGTRPEGIPDAYAEEVINLLVPRAEWVHLSSPSAREGCVRAILFDYGARGKLVALHRVLDIRRRNHIEVLLEPPDAIRLRHRITVGTDLASWSMLRKESNWPAEAPFKRTYVFAAPEPVEGVLRGLAYFEGAVVTLAYRGPVNPEQTRGFEQLTWRLARRLETIYPTHLQAIAEGPLFEDNPVLTRPDLPDADLREPH